MEGLIDKCSNKEKEELDNYLSLAIFVSGLPLSTVENQSVFYQFCKKLHPAYELPLEKHSLSNC